MTTELQSETVLSRFEEGKPADPTENMSPEDAKKWREQTDEHKDEFKVASNKEAKLMSRQEKILKDYLASAGSRAVMEYDDLPSSVRDALTKVKDQETLWSDVNRWLGDNNNPHLRSAALRPNLERLISSVEDSAKQLRHSFDLYNRNPQKYTPQLDNILSTTNNLHSVVRVLSRGVETMVHSSQLQNEPLRLASKVVARFTEAEVRERSQGDAGCNPKAAGFSTGIGSMSVLFVEGRKRIPFNIDTIHEINRTSIPVIGDDGIEHIRSLSITNKESSDFPTRIQEEDGWRMETRVDIRFPIEIDANTEKASESFALKELTALGHKLGFVVEPVSRGYKPQMRHEPSYAIKRKIPGLGGRKFPFR